MNHGPLWNGDVIGGRYRMLKRIGEGGMGNVFLVEDLKLNGKKWAVKEIEASEYGSEGYSLHAEAEVLMQLNHPFLPEMVDYLHDEMQQKVYLVMEFIEGMTVQAWFDREQGNPPVQAVLELGLQLCDVLSYLHHQQPQPIVYRDLKPSNLMLDQHMHIRLIDFGTARHFKQGQTKDTLQLGTFAYAAPEQLHGRQTDHRTDLYQLGATLYYLLSKGQYYYTSKQPLHQINPDFSLDCSVVIQKLLEDDPSDRFQSAADVRRALDRCLAVMKEKTEVLTLQNSEPEARDATNLSITPMERMNIIVCGLYPGVGSTFVSVSLARMLHLAGITNAVVEHPSQSPELYEWLHGSRHAPKTYTFYTERASEHHMKAVSKWKTGYTTWYPLNPDRNELNDDENWFVWLHQLKDQMIIIDMPQQWDNESMREWTTMADVVLVVASPDPVKMNSKQVMDRLNVIEQWKQAGKEVLLVGNRMEPLSYMKEWERSLPIRPSCMLPSYPSIDVMKCRWQGSLLQDHKQYSQAMFQAMEPLLSAVLPKQAVNLNRKRKRWLIF